MESKTDNKKTAHDMMFEDLDRFVHGELRFSSCEMEKRFLKELAWVWTEFRDLENGGCQRAKFVTEYWSENALRKIYEISSKDKKPVNLKDIKGYLAQGIVSSISVVEKDLRHEHVVPKKLFINTILKMKEKGNVPSDFKDKLLQRYVGCILTKKEAEQLDSKHRNYPDNGKLLDSEDFDCWVRYRECNEETLGEPIKIYKCKVLKRNHHGRSWGLEIIGLQDLG